jgi:23S rRNA pseudouridine2605 synthase
VEKSSSFSTNFWATITLFEGKNREIRKIMEHFGCSVNRLIRISYGPFELGKLAPGKFVQITEEEISQLLTSI